eukprot:gene302-3672_t
MEAKRRYNEKGRRSSLQNKKPASQQKRQKRDIQRKARSQHALQKKLQNQKQEEQAEADRESGDFGTMRNTKSKSLLGSSMPSTKEFKADHNESGTSRDSSQYDTDTDDGDDHDDDILLSAELKQLDRSNNTDDKAVRNKKIPESCKNRSRKLTVTHLREGYSSASIPGLNRNVVFVKRKPEINETRSKLPVVHQEQEIMEAINSHNVIVICGPTGSGKTTQLPQFVYEAGYNQGFGGKELLIGVTEPRRIAAISVSGRVAEELSLSSREVAYQVRYDNSVTAQTKIKFMTDGVLQKEIEQDFALRKYSVIIIDEAHERSMHTDIVIGLISRIIPLRNGMYKDSLVDFTENPTLFPNLTIPVIEVGARQYKVTTHFSKRTRVDNDPVTCVTRAVTRIHRQLPAGGILVFMTGQAEILQTCRKLRQLFSGDHIKCKHMSKSIKMKEEENVNHPGKVTANEIDASKEKIVSTVAKIKEEINPEALNLCVPQSTSSSSEAVVLRDHSFDQLQSSTVTNGSNNEDMVSSSEKELEIWGDEISFDDSDESDFDEDAESVDHGCDDTSDVLDSARMKKSMVQLAEDKPLHVLPLFSNLSRKAQSRVFEGVPEGHRLCVIATNVAETSITIPGVTYVVDTGLVKKANYDAVTGAVSFTIDWTSKASAKQRAGRAGRTAAGHCYRLYSAAVFNEDFEEHSEPEICKIPADGLILQMKAMGIEKVVNFPFPTPPSREALKAGEHTLFQLNALDRNGKITNVGRAMSRYPVAPRYAKMLALAKHYNCQNETAAIVAALTVKSLLHSEDFEKKVTETDGENLAETFADPKVSHSQWRAIGRQKQTDFAVFLAIIGATDFEIERNVNLETFCSKLKIRCKAILETRKLRQQLLALGETTSINTADNVECDFGAQTVLKALEIPTDHALDHIRQITLAAFPDNVARREATTSQNRASGYRCGAVEDLVYIHPTSALYGSNHEFLVFHHLTQSKSRYYMRDVTVISQTWIPKLAPICCTFSKPLIDPAPRYDSKVDDMRCYVTATYGPYEWPVPAQEVSFPDSPERYRHFAKALLNGDVLRTLKQFVPRLLNRPEIMCKSWSKSTHIEICAFKERISRLLAALVDQKISTLHDLCLAFASDPTCKRATVTAELTITF